MANKQYSILEVRKLRRKMKYGDCKLIAGITGFSIPAVTQVMKGKYYNQSIIMQVEKLISERQN